MSRPRFRVLTLSVMLVSLSIVLLSASTAFSGGITLPNGSAEKAIEYYRGLAGTLRFRTSATILDATFDDFLAYLGYHGLTVGDLERLDPDPLMTLGQAGKPLPVANAQVFGQTIQAIPVRPGDILVSRFFAPKISNVALPVAERKTGWRKLLRIKARKGSEADKHAIDYAVILLNHFTTGNEPPFGVNATSINTQVALVTQYPQDVGPPSGGACKSKLDSIYWLDFNATKDGAKLSLKLDNSFDARDLQPSEPGGQPGNVAYFVPDGCDSCHGDPPPRLGRSQLNYLDTDHWYDRARDDFPQVTQAGLPVLFDAGNDFKSPRFAQAFDVLRQLNEEFDRQQRAIDPGSFHRASTQTWLKVHERSAEPAPPLARAIDPTLVAPGGQGARWGANADEEAVLGLLSHYCFRCHGSIRFNVMNRSSVLQRRVEIRGRLKPNAEQARITGFEMPPDRTLPEADRDRILQLMSRMPRQ